MRPAAPRFEKAALERWREWEKGRAVNFFQTAEWAELLARHYPQFTLAPLEGDHFFIPLVHSRRWGWLSDSYYGMPLMTTGGVLFAETPSETLWREARLRLSNLTAGSVVVVFPPGEVPPSGDLFEVEERTTHLVSLEGGWDEVWNRYKQRGRTSVRKAEDLGVTVQRDEGEDAIRAHWEIIDAHLPLWKPNPTPTFEFVRDAARSSAGRLYIARCSGNVVGSILVFAHGKEVFFWQSGRVLEDPPHGTSNMLMSAPLKEACEEGCYERANLGASLSIPAIEAFKESLGAKRAVYYILKRVHPLVKVARRLGAGRNPPRPSNGAES
jgi:hypothetical protein